MRRLEAMPEVEKTSIFGTAVHAVMRSPDARPDAVAAALAAAGISATCRIVDPSLEDVFLDVAEKGARHEGIRGGGEGVPADREGPPHADDPALRAGVLPVAVRLRAQLRHPQHPARGAGQRSQQRQQGSHLRVREFRLLPADSGCASSCRRRRCAQPRRRAGGARDSRRLRPGRRHRTADRGSGAHQRRQREYGDDRDGLRRRARKRAVGALRSAGARRLRARPAADGGDARLVQPRAPQHPLSRARPDCVHRDADGGGLDGAVDRPRKGSRHDGAGEDVAGGAAGLRHRQDDAVFRRVAGVGDRHCGAVDAAVRPADARIVGDAVPRDFDLPGRRAGVRRADLDARRDAAGRVPARPADVVPADADAVGVHLSDLQHAAGAAGDHIRGAGALLPDRAARDRAQGRRPRGLLAGHRRAGRVRGDRAVAGVAPAEARVGGWANEAHPAPHSEGIPGAPAGSAAVRHRHHGAAHPAHDARLCRHHRRPQRAARRGGRGPVRRQPRADFAVRGL